MLSFPRVRVIFSFLIFRIVDLKNVGDDNLNLSDDGDFGGGFQANSHDETVLLPDTQQADG